MRALLSYFISLLGKQIWKMSLLVIYEIMRLFVTILTADNKHPLWNCENLSLPIQIQLSKKRKTFLHFSSISGICIKFQTFPKKKMIVIANVFPKLQTVKGLVRPLSKKPFFRTNLDRQHAKGSQTLAKSVWEQFHYLFHHSEENWFGKCLP